MRRWAGVALIAALLAGCAHAVDGAAEPATAAPGILPTESEITSAVGNTLSTFGFAPFIGGVEILPDGYRTDADATPIDCVAVTDTAPRVVYEKSDVVEAARQSYFNLNPGVGTSGADAAVVRMSTAEAAQRTFDGFVRQWQQCSGTAVVKHLRGVNNTEVDAAVSDVTVAAPVVSATVTTKPRPDGPASLYQRALGVRGDTIVEVSLATTPPGERQPMPRAQAVRVAEAMLAKVGSDS
jgi:hypothetical protein